jgi:hypothetical protein
MEKSGRLLAAFAAIPMLAGMVGPAFAGTKFQTNIVPSSAVSPPTNPTLSTKGKIQFDDKGKILLTVKGVTDGAGDPVTTSTAIKDSLKATGTPVADDTTYVAVVRGTFTALGIQFEMPVPFDLKKGNGTTKLAEGAQFSQIPGGIGRSVEINGVEVWGPLGAGNVAACNSVLANVVTLVTNDPSCRGGTKIGVAGINFP